MPVPDFQSLMRPLLATLSNGTDHPIQAIRDDLATEFSLTQSEVSEMIPSGRITTFQNRVGWATTYLYRAGLIERPKRAVYRIADRGRVVLEEHPERIDLKVLSQFDEFNAFRQARTSRDQVATKISEAAPSEGETETPEERIDSAYDELRAALAANLHDRIMDETPEFFERLVLDVLHAIGYGGRRDDATQHLGRSGDEGIDGVVREDRLGLDQIYLQAKRWQQPVGRPEIQKFFGALHGKAATKGVFITTSTFSREAIDYADKVTPRVILIDGKELAKLMIEYRVGVTVERSYELKRLDLDYFTTDDEPGLASVPSGEAG